MHYEVSKIPPEALLESILNSPIPFALIVTDKEKHVLLWNEGAQLLFEYSKEEVLGKKLPHIAPSLTPPTLSNSKSNTEETTDLREYLGEILTKSGAVLSVKVSLTDCHYEPLGFHGDLYAVRDISKEKILAYANKLESLNAQKAPAASEKDSRIIQSLKLAMLGEMATSVAHEINQPLGSISLITQGIKKAAEKGLLNTAMLFDRLSAFNAQIERISRIINHLRVFGRQAPEELVPVDINRPVQDVFVLLGQQLINHRIMVSTELASQLPPVLADANKLEQVFLNLVSNARDALNDQESKVKKLLEGNDPPDWALFWQKKLTIRTYLSDGFVCTEFKDTAGGVPESIRDKIFEPFFTTKEIGKGTGLGLSISYGIIRSFSGEIKMESTDNKGTVFKVCLPAIEAGGTHAH